MKFFVGLHHEMDAGRVRAPVMISINRLRRRTSSFPVGKWILDSGGFTEILAHGCYRESAAEHAARIRFWSGVGELVAAVAQDWMCEEVVLARTRLTVADHQRLTIERYDELVACDVGGVYIMPVLQGYKPSEYVEHLRAYGERLAFGAWVGVGSVCKRNDDPAAILAVLRAIKRARPDLRLHGFGLKKTALASAEVLELLESADSMAWSYAARKQGRDANDPREAERFAAEVCRLAERDRPVQLALPLGE